VQGLPRGENHRDVLPQPQATRFSSKNIKYLRNMSGTCSHIITVIIANYETPATGIASAEKTAMYIYLKLISTFILNSSLKVFFLPNLTFEETNFLSDSSVKLL
jgi:hypothetical protein